MAELSVAELRKRLDGLTIRDAARLGRRLKSLRGAKPEKLQQLAEQIAAAEALVAARQAAVPRITYPELPVSARRRDIAEAVRAHQVVVVAGETGSGKTTQLPKICLDIGRGISGTIGHTQPRRLAARTVAQHRRRARKPPRGSGRLHGRFTDQVSDRTLVKLMTDGILLAEIQCDRRLRRYDTLILDEAHERSLKIDFLLGYLRELLPRRPDLKVIGTSATRSRRSSTRSVNSRPNRPGTSWCSCRVGAKSATPQLLPPGFVTATGDAYLTDLTRYPTAIRRRLDQLPYAIEADPRADATGARRAGHLARTAADAGSGTAGVGRRPRYRSPDSRVAGESLGAATRNSASGQRAADLPRHRRGARPYALTVSHFQSIAHGGLAARPGSCRKIAGRSHDSWKWGMYQVDLLRAPDTSRREAEPISDHSVVIVGGGPTGLMLGGELALAGIDVAIVERRPNPGLVGSRADGLHSRTIEILDQRGIADRFLAAGQVAQVAGFAQIRLDISDFPTRHPYGLALWQNHIERKLSGWVDQLGVLVYCGRQVSSIRQDRAGVNVELSEGQSLRTEYLVGCDGGRSVVRKAAGIGFPGWDPTTSYLIAEAEMAADEAPPWGIRHDALGVHALSTSEEKGSVRVMVTEKHIGPTTQPTLRELSEALITVYGTRLRNPQPHLDFQIHRCGTTGHGLAHRTGPAGRRRRTCAPPRGWARPQHQCSGRGESGLEIGPSNQRDIAGHPPRHLSRRTTPGRRPGIAQCHGADGASSSG